MKWVSVEEGLPESEAELLLNWVEDREISIRSMGTWTMAEGFVDCHGSADEDCDVTHWMLIEPPC